MSDEHMDGLCKHEIDRFRCIRCLRDENTQLRADLASLRLQYDAAVEALPGLLGDAFMAGFDFSAEGLNGEWPRETPQSVYLARAEYVTQALAAARALQGGTEG